LGANDERLIGMSLPGRPPLPRDLDSSDWKEGQMKKTMGLGALLLAGLLAIPGNLWLASQVLAQSDTKTMEDKQLQDLRQNRQETLPEKEREAKPPQDTGKGGEDAITRQKTADPQFQDLDEEDD
jgi:hypothetical protein